MTMMSAPSTTPIRALTLCLPPLRLASREITTACRPWVTSETNMGAG